MALFLTWTAGLIIWIVLWALGAKGFDAFLITLLLMILGVVMHLIVPRLPGHARAPAASDDPAPFN